MGCVGVNLAFDIPCACNFFCKKRSINHLFLLVCIQAAERDAVEPAVQGYMDRLRAEASTLRIRTLRQEALSLAQHVDETLFVKQALHAPTVALRQGKHLDDAAFLQTLRKDLEHRRVAGETKCR